MHAPESGREPVPAPATAAVGCLAQSSVLQRIHAENSGIPVDTAPYSETYHEDEMRSIMAMSSKLKAMTPADMGLYALCDALAFVWRLNLLLTSYTKRKRDLLLERSTEASSKLDGGQSGSPARSDIIVSSCVTPEERLDALAVPLPQWPVEVAVLPSAEYFRQRRTNARNLRSGRLSTEADIIPLISINEGTSMKESVDSVHCIQDHDAVAIWTDVTPRSSDHATETIVTPLRPSPRRDTSANPEGARPTVDSSQITAPPGDHTSMTDGHSIWYRAKRLLPWSKKQTT